MCIRDSSKTESRGLARPLSMRSRKGRPMPTIRQNVFLLIFARLRSRATFAPSTHDRHDPGGSCFSGVCEGAAFME